MSQVHYAVIFRGRLAEHADPAQVQVDFARMTKLSPEKAAALFAGKQVTTLKRCPSIQDAERIAAGLKKIGMLVDISLVAAQAKPEVAAGLTEMQLAATTTV